jgi:hypothetical protein
MVIEIPVAGVGHFNLRIGCLDWRDTVAADLDRQRPLPCSSWRRFDRKFRGALDERATYHLKSAQVAGKKFLLRSHE